MCHFCSCKTLCSLYITKKKTFKILSFLHSLKKKNLTLFETKNITCRYEFIVQCYERKLYSITFLLNLFHYFSSVVLETAIQSKTRHYRKHIFQFFVYLKFLKSSRSISIKLLSNRQSCGKCCDN